MVKWNYAVRSPETGNNNMPENRLSSIDMLRGLVMVLMALDHVRDMLSPPPVAGLDFSEAGAPLFFTRWITHICAPTFILLAGIGAFLYGSKGRSKSQVSRFLLTRGLWLILIELTIVGFAWNFNLGPGYVWAIQVLWAIGASMIALAALIWLPLPVIGAIGIAMILGHNLLDGIQPAAADASALWLLAHIQGLITINGKPFVWVVYPIIPWIGVMALGYVMGPLFLSGHNERPRLLIRSGLILIALFLLLRFFNFYGEPDTWTTASAMSVTLVDFFNTTKYPPSLQFLLMTLGPALVLLGYFERAGGKFADAMITIGKVPFFFYILHLYFIHLVALGLGLIQGFSISDIAVAFFMYPKDFGINLAAVYVAWIAIVIILYFPCLWFSKVKANSRKWWLSYL